MKQIHMKMILSEDEMNLLKQTMKNVRKYNTTEEYYFFKRAVMIAYFITHSSNPQIREGFISFRTFMNMLTSDRYSTPYDALIKRFGFNTLKSFFFGVPMEFMYANKKTMTELERYLVDSTL